MSCDCENYQGPCREELPYPIVSAESVPSLISNLAYALYGATRKSVVNGSIVWNILCDPNLTAQITGLPRNAGEGLLCYFIRCFNLIVSNAFLIQPGSIDPTKLTTGGPSWNPSGDLTIGRNLNVTGTANIANITGNAATATLATAATNIAGGATGSLPYQSAAGTTSLLATTGASANWVLALSSGLLPSWKQASVAATGSAFALRDGGGGLTASQFNGPLIGNVTGNVTGSSTTVIGATASPAAGYIGEIVIVSNTVNFPTGTSYSGTNQSIANLGLLSAGTWDISSLVQISGSEFGTSAATVWQAMMGTNASLSPSNLIGPLYTATPTITAGSSTSSLTLFTPSFRKVGGPFNSIQSIVNLTFTGASAAISVTSTITAQRVC